VLETFGDREFRRQFAEHDFVEYYKENPNGFFAVGVWTNNAWIAVQFVLLGITGVYVVAGLFSNAVNVGFSGAMMFEFDRASDFFLYILPHGIPEISCIILAAAAGLRLFFAWVVPGPRPRRDKLAAEAGRCSSSPAGSCCCCSVRASSKASSPRTRFPRPSRSPSAWPIRPLSSPTPGTSASARPGRG
jgi:uncharacterized membrane protein SpoIIM required for sporulation